MRRKSDLFIQHLASVHSLGLEDDCDVKNEPTVVVYHGVTVDETAMISVRHHDELALDIYRHRTNTAGPAIGQVAAAIVAVAQSRWQRTVIGTVIIADDHDVAIAVVTATPVVAVAAVPIATIIAIPTVVAVAAVITNLDAAVSASALVSGFRAIDEHCSAQHGNGDHD
jgi:hypothetical protein